MMNEFNDNKVSPSDSPSAVLLQTALAPPALGRMVESSSALLQQHQGSTLSTPSTLNLPLPQRQGSVSMYPNSIIKTDASLQKRPSTTNVCSLVTTTNTNLGERLVGDVAVATTVTAVVAPFLTVIDKALVQRAAGSHTLLQSARQSMTQMISNPIQYLKSPTYLWMWATYAATYSAANMLRTITEQRVYQSLSSTSTSSLVREQEQQRSAATTTATLFVGTTMVNSTASMIKDRAYAQLFGSSTAAASAVPTVSYALWMARDLTVIGSSFVLPTHVAKLIQEQSNQQVSQEHATKIAQVMTPMAAQLIAGPLHYVGLDCYTRPLSYNSTTNVWSMIQNRCQQLSKAYNEVVAARMIRILPGYGIAGVYNTSFRNQYRHYLVQCKVQQMMEQEALQLVLRQQPTTAVVPVISSSATSVPTTLAATATSSSTAPRELVALIRAHSKRYEASSTVAGAPSTTP